MRTCNMPFYVKNMASLQVIIQTVLTHYGKMPFRSVARGLNTFGAQKLSSGFGIILPYRRVMMGMSRQRTIDEAHNHSGMTGTLRKYGE